MNLKKFIAVCGVSLSLTAGASEFPFGSLEKFWDYVETNTYKVTLDVKGIKDGQWVANLEAKNVPYNRATDGPIQEFLKREFSKRVLAAFAKHSDEELRQYDEFTSLIWCLSPKHTQALYQIAWRYTLDEVDGKLVVPDHIRNPVLSLEETGYRPGKVPGLASAELFIRKGKQLMDYQESWPFSPNGAYLLVDEEYLVVPMPLATGANGGELVLYYTNGVTKVIDLATGDTATSYPPLDQPELVFGVAYWYQKSVQKPQSALSTREVLPLDFRVVKGRGKDLTIEYTSDFKSWSLLREIPNSGLKEFFFDYTSEAQRFYRVRAH